MDQTITAKTAKDVMTETVISISPDSPIDDAIAILLENNISGLPVISDDGRIVGILSEVDRLKMLKNPSAQHFTQVADIMTRNVVSVDVDSPLAYISHLLLSGAIRRVPVVRHGSVVGIVSRRDLIRAMREESDRN